MGWEIAQKGDTFRIWSTNSDTYITGWISREEVLQMYYDHAFFTFKQRVIEEYLTFPHHWGRAKSLQIMTNEEGFARWDTWLRELLEKSHEDRVAFVDGTYAQIMKELHR